MKTLNLPEGYELDLENSTRGNIVIKKLPKELPKTWKDLKRNVGYVTETTWAKQELAQASKALSKLLFLRDAYNENWKQGDKTDTDRMYVIENKSNIIFCDTYYDDNRYNKLLSFKTEKLRDEFLNNFKDLITIALPLL